MNKAVEEFKFNPRLSTEEGLVAIGGELTVARLQEAYEMGVFPWPQEGLPMLWFSPLSRGILDFANLRINRSLTKFLRQLELVSMNKSLSRSMAQRFSSTDHIQQRWVYSVDKDFSRVISECQMLVRKGQTGTWILPEMKTAYEELHRAGHAHSIEIWEHPGTHEVSGESEWQIIGGIYGVMSKKYFSAESMFFKKSNASKVAFLVLTDWLQDQGHQWMDIQMLTEVSSSFGGQYIDREEFLRRIGV